jgi:hypothetical protein
MADPKSTWPIIEFLIAGTGLKNRDARIVLNQIPPDRYTKLFMEAAAWKRDTCGQASKTLRELIGEYQVPSLSAVVTEGAQEPTPRKRKTAHKRV